MRISQLLAAGDQPRPITVTWKGGTVAGTYRPFALSTNFLANFDPTNPQHVERLDKLLAHVLLTWDVTDETDQPVALTASLIAQLDVAFKKALADAMAADMKVK